MERFGGSASVVTMAAPPRRAAGTVTVPLVGADVQFQLRPVLALPCAMAVALAYRYTNVDLSADVAAHTALARWLVVYAGMGAADAARHRVDALDDATLPFGVRSLNDPCGLVALARARKQLPFDVVPCFKALLVAVAVDAGAGTLTTTTLCPPPENGPVAALEVTGGAMLADLARDATTAQGFVRSLNKLLQQSHDGWSTSAVSVVGAAGATHARINAQHYPTLLTSRFGIVMMRMSEGGSSSGGGGGGGITATWCPLLPRHLADAQLSSVVAVAAVLLGGTTTTPRVDEICARLPFLSRSMVTAAMATDGASAASAATDVERIVAHIRLLLREQPKPKPVPLRKPEPAPEPEPEPQPQPETDAESSHRHAAGYDEDDDDDDYDDDAYDGGGAYTPRTDMTEHTQYTEDARRGNNGSPSASDTDSDWGDADDNDGDDDDDDGLSLAAASTTSHAAPWRDLRHDWQDAVLRMRRIESGTSGDTVVVLYFTPAAWAQRARALTAQLDEFCSAYLVLRGPRSTLLLNNDCARVVKVAKLKPRRHDAGFALKVIRGSSEARRSVHAALLMERTWLSGPLLWSLVLMRNDLLWLALCADDATRALVATLWHDHHVRGVPGRRFSDAVSDALIASACDDAASRRGTVANAASWANGAALELVFRCSDSEAHTVQRHVRALGRALSAERKVVNLVIEPARTELVLATCDADDAVHVSDVLARSGADIVVWRASAALQQRAFRFEDVQSWSEEPLFGVVFTPLQLSLVSQIGAAPQRNALTNLLHARAKDMINCAKLGALAVDDADEVARHIECGRTLAKQW